MRVDRLRSQLSLSRTLRSPSHNHRNISQDVCSRIGRRRTICFKECESRSVTQLLQARGVLSPPGSCAAAYADDLALKVLARISLRLLDQRTDGRSSWLT